MNMSTIRNYYFLILSFMFNYLHRVIIALIMEEDFDVAVILFNE